MKLILTLLTFCLMSSLSFADSTKLRGIYKNSYQISKTELFQHLGTSDIKFKCIEYCARDYVTILVVYDKDKKKKTWVWSADLYVKDNFHSQAFSFDFLIKQDTYGQITFITLGLDFPKEQKRVVVEDHRSDPIDWNEVRRISQESIDANTK